MVRTNAVAKFSSAERVVVSLFAAYAMFLVGYTVARVSVMEAEPTAASTQVNVVPHQGELWRSVGE